MTNSDQNRGGGARASARTPGVLPEARPGDLVTVHYTSRNRDGGVFETSSNRRPLQFVAGRGEVIEGVSRAVIGMRPGETRTVEIPPSLGFGERDPNLEHTVPRAFLPDSAEEGDQLTVGICDRELDVWVKRLTPELAILDGNHPLAGEPLVVELSLVTLDRPPR